MPSASSIYTTAYTGGVPITGFENIGNIAVDVTGNGNTTLGNFVSGIPVQYDSTGYVIISDTTTAGLVDRTTGNNTGTASANTPTFWVSNAKDDPSFLNLTNRLPQRYNLSPFIDTSSAKSWLNSNGYWTSYINSIITSTSSIFIVGNFETYGESYIQDRSIVRISSDGTKDVTFDNQNKFDRGSNVSRVFLTSDQNLIAISTAAMTNYNATSSYVHLIDSSGNRINSNNIYNKYQVPNLIWQTIKDIKYDLSVGSTHSGKIYVAFDVAGLTAGGHTVSYFARYNSNWTIDTSFNTYLTSTQSGFNLVVNTIKLLSDGNILVGGNFTTYKGSNVSSARICKLDPSGNTMSFSTGASTGFNNSVLSIDEDASGNIYVGGSWTFLNGTTPARMAKLSSSGARNGSFLPSFTSGQINQVLVDTNDNNIFVISTQAAGTDYGKKLIKLSSTNGSTASGYSSGYSIGIAPSRMSIHTASNSLYFVGQQRYYNTTVNMGLTKVNTTTGLIDSNFSLGSRLVDATVRPNDCILDNNGKLIVVGNFNYFKSINFNTVKIGPTGQLESSYNPYPVSTSPASGVKKDNKGNLFYWSITTDGYYDKVFYINGGPGDWNSIPNTGYPSGVIKVSATGSFDTTFIPRIRQLSGTVFTVDFDESRYALYVGGSFTRTSNGGTGDLINKICRMSATNSLIDSTFVTGTGFRNSVGTEGVASTPYVYSIKYDSVIDKVYVGGTFLLYNGSTASKIIRLSSTGSYDQSFNVFISSTQSGFNNDVRVVNVDRTGGSNDGKLYVGGNFTTYKGITQSRICRLNTDGSLDTNFNIGTGANSIVNKIEIRPDGKIFISGSFTTYNGSTVSSVCLISDDGTLDTSFDTGIGFQYTGLGDSSNVYSGSPTIKSIKYDNSDKLWIVGDFGKYRGENKNCIVRVNMNGTIDSTFDDSTYGVQNSSGILDIDIL